MENVRWETFLGAAFTRDAFERAFARFSEIYSARPTAATCAPDVLARFCALYERSADVAHRRATTLAFDGIPLTAAIMPPGTVALEGTVDEDRMGDW